jgi:hypothetical protein
VGRRLHTHNKAYKTLGVVVTYVGLVLDIAMNTACTGNRKLHEDMSRESKHFSLVQVTENLVSADKAHNM